LIVGESVEDRLAPNRVALAVGAKGLVDEVLIKRSRGEAAYRDHAGDGAGSVGSATKAEEEQIVVLLVRVGEVGITIFDTLEKAFSEGSGDHMIDPGVESTYSGLIKLNLVRCC